MKIVETWKQTTMMMMMMMMIILVTTTSAQQPGCTGSRYLDPIPKPVPEDLLFPLPSSYQSGISSYYVATTITITSPNSSDILNRAMQRYISIIIPPSFHHSSNHHSMDDATITSLEVIIDSSDETLSLNTDESYYLSVKAPTSSIQSPNIYGAIRALESFSQLISYSSGTPIIANGPWKINDKPRYSHRGFLIDTGRHYLKQETILRTLDAMSYSKLNVLHWHIVDAQSFAYASPSFPSLSSASFSPSQIYTPEMITNIVQYAKDRGIRVIIEIETPQLAVCPGVSISMITLIPLSFAYCTIFVIISGVYICEGEKLAEEREGKEGLA
eukprot:TRINITY_DN2721_c0_g3_i1.p1 TRINITY_DN2721_c0_g3~~TRINITY_DN2721_c0_g3_i1.p1  ORF type:complete len:329 (+),score=88.79 TRINITY_DN2721_c0_g3_i1:11-997(+)